MCCIAQKDADKLSVAITLTATKHQIEMLERTLMLPDEQLRLALQIERDVAKEHVQELLDK